MNSFCAVYFSDKLSRYTVTTIYGDNPLGKYYSEDIAGFLTGEPVINPSYPDSKCFVFAVFLNITDAGYFAIKMNDRKFNH